VTRTRTRTYAILDVSEETCGEVCQLLQDAGYEHAIHDDLVDMHGIALRAAPSSRRKVPASYRPVLAKLARDLERTRRTHSHCDDSWYCCGMCTHPDHSSGPEDYPASHRNRTSGRCDCGAASWNETLERLLAELSCLT
jgi:hypothetical protein